MLQSINIAIVNYNVYTNDNIMISHIYIYIPVTIPISQYCIVFPLYSHHIHNIAQGGLEALWVVLKEGDQQLLRLGGSLTCIEKWWINRKDLEMCNII